MSDLDDQDVHAESVDDSLGGKEEEEEEEEEPEEEVVVRRKKTKKRNTLADFVDEEAAVSSDEEVSADEDEGDEHGDEMNLIDDSEEVVVRGRRKKRRRREDALAEGDIELLKEAGVNYQRGLDEDVDDDDSGKQRKRIKKKRHQEDEEEPLDGVDQVKDLEARLFGFQDSDDDERPPEKEQKAAESFIEEEEVPEEEFYGQSNASEQIHRAKEVFGGDLSALFDADFISDTDDEEPEEEESAADDSGMSGDDERKKKKPLTKAEQERHTFELDIPERLQPRQRKRVHDPVDLITAIQTETTWICSNAFSSRNNEAVRNLIEIVLNFIRTEHLEPPFIALYRKEHLKHPEEGEELSEDDVYLINRWDVKWVALEQRRLKLEKMAHEMKLKDEDLEHTLQAACASSQLDDVQDYLRSVRLTDDLHPEAAGKATVKRSEGRQFRILQFAENIHGLAELSNMMGITARQFGDNLRAMHQIHKPEDSEHDVREVAEDLVTNMAPNVESVLRFTCEYTARKISLDVVARQSFRNLMMSRALISTTPTPKGVKEINWVHSYCEVKRIQNRPISTLANTTTFRLLLNAHKEGFIKYEIHFLNQAALDKKSTSCAPLWFQNMDQIDQEELIDIMLRTSKSEQHCLELEQFIVENAQQFEGRFEAFPLEDRPDAQPRDFVEELVNWFFNAGVEDLVAELSELYLNNLSHSASAKEWDLQRTNTLRAAVRTLKSDTIKHILELLTGQADEQVIEEATKRFKEMACKGKYTSEDQDDENELTILSIVVGDEESPTTCVLLTEYGDVQDYQSYDFMKSKVSARSIAEGSRIVYDRKKKDIRMFQEFLEQRRPNLILIDAADMESFYFQTDLVKTVLTEFPHIQVQFVDPAMGIIFEHSERGLREFKDYTGLMRRAIGMGRMVLDPISELAALWYLNEESVKTQAFQNREVLSLDLHSLVSSIDDKGLLLRSLEEVLVRMVNYIGVDINKLPERMHLSHSLQFVSGLGEVKAKRLYAALNRKGFFASRDELSDENQGLFGQVVYQNCVGFLQIYRNYNMDDGPNEISVSPLEATRIHPDSFEYTEQIIRSVLESDDEDEDDDDDDDDDDDESEAKQQQRRNKFINKVEKVMEAEKLPELEDLDLERFAEQEDKNILDTLLLIKAEIKHAFKDYKHLIRQYSPPKGDVLFDMLTGETKSFLRAGCRVFATVYRTNEKGAYCKIEGGLAGFLDAANMDNSNMNDNFEGGESKKKRIEELFRDNKVLECRIVRIDRERCEVTLTAKGSELSKKKDLQMEQDLDHWRPDIRYSQYTFPGIHHDDKKILDPFGDAKRSNFIERNIVHPLFHNIDREKAIEHLANKQQGDAVVRPSSKGIYFLSVTWKVAAEEDGMCFDFEIEEKNKLENDMLGLGRELYVAGKAYEDLDEVLAEFLDPMIQFSNQIVSHAKFRFGDEEEILEVLQSETTNTVPYTIWIDPSKPGIFRFSYLKKNEIRHVDFRLLPEGYRFRSQNHQKLSKLIDSIKRYIVKKMTGGGRQQRRSRGLRSSGHRDNRSRGHPDNRGHPRKRE